MSLSKYYYNPESCRYEPSRTSPINIAGIAILFCISTTVIFGGILFLHSKLFLTEKGKALKKENIALVKHKASIRQGLTSINTVLASLQEQNSNLHKKIFETPLEAVTGVNAKKENLILVNESGFRSEATELEKEIEQTAKTSAEHNYRFSTLEVTNKDLTFLLAVPSIQPVENTELTKLASGFGSRINPFHKGNYHHPGADFAAARGTSVFATAKGIIVDIRKGSSIQAGYGNYIEIDHGNGLITRYAHLDDVSVRMGQRISKGTMIGTVGMSGGAIAPHLHYEIIRKGKQVDPVPYLMEYLNSNDYIALQELGSKKNQSLD
jgi:murein DD-endopeptidase MepM/ murein hydrolase activator NlpD